jgi:hypothetical protein
METILLDTLKQIQEGELLNTSPICFSYKHIEFEFSLNDEDQQEYVASGIALKKSNQTYDEAVKYMTAHIASDGYRYCSNIEYTLSQNEVDNTYNLTLYVQLSFHFSHFIQNKADYLLSYVLDNLTGRIQDYYYVLDIIESNS